MKLLTADTLKVIPINTELLEEEINSILPKKEGVVYFISRNIAIVPDVDIITDKECIYNIPEDGTLNFEIHEKTETEEGYSLSLLPCIRMSCTLDELKNDFALPETSLKEFMKGRFDYNPRIMTNTREFLKDVNSRIVNLIKSKN